METFEIPENNKTTFHTLIVRDKNHIYHGYAKMKNIDRNSFEYVADNYWKDKNYVYAEYETSLKPLKGLDVKNFKYLGNGFAVDKNYAYHRGTYIKSCKKPLTFEIIEGEKYAGFAKDADNIYYLGTALKNVDKETWEYLGKSYSKDKNKVYHMSLIEDDKNPEEWNKEKVIQHYK